MKRHLFLITTCMVLAWNTSSLAIGELGESGGANNNPHNLSSLNSIPLNPQEAQTETQICIFCHTPHGASPQSKLWGRPDPVGMGTFPTFSNGDTTAVKDPGTPTKNLGIDDGAIIGTTGYGTGEYPNGASKLCLSCHDGVTAMGILANGTEIDMNGTNRALKVIDLSKSHPISFVYTLAVETHLNTVATSKFYDFNYYTGSKAIPLDGQSRIQCTICHEPHKNTKTGGYNLPFWRMKGTGVDELADYDNTCKVCHSATYYNGANHNIIP